MVKARLDTSSGLAGSTPWIRRRAPCGSDADAELRVNLAPSIPALSRFGDLRSMEDECAAPEFEFYAIHRSMCWVARRFTYRTERPIHVLEPE